MKSRDIYWRRYKILQTLYIGQWLLSPLQSRHLGTAHSFPSCLQPPSLIFPKYEIFPKSHRQSEISSISKVILVLGKARSHKEPNLGSSGSESAGWFDVSLKTPHDTWCMSGTLSWRSCQSPVGHSCGLLNHLSSFHGGMFKTNSKAYANLLLY